MKFPKSELPWKISKKLPLNIINDKVLVVEGYDIEDSEYIVQACNNFPLAIGYTKVFLAILKIHRLDESDEERINLIKAIEEFLKSLDT